MARIRTIKPEAFTSASLSSVSRGCRWTYAGLWTYVDDAGVGPDSARLIWAALYPLDDSTTVDDVEADLAALEAVGAICRYTAGGKAYLHVIEWHHQRINRPSKATHPACVIPHGDSNSVPDWTDEHSRDQSGDEMSAHAPLSEPSSTEVEVEVEVEQGSGSGTGNPPPPSVVVPPHPKAAKGTRIPESWRPDDALRAWTLEAGLTQAEAADQLLRFRDFWRAKPGRDAAKLDWDSTWRNWIRRYLDERPRAPGARAPTPRPSTTDARVQAGLDLVRKFAAEEGLTA